MAALVSLTICPTFGLSSGATSFIPLSTAVSSPFLPRNLTRTSLSFSGCVGRLDLRDRLRFDLFQFLFHLLLLSAVCLILRHHGIIPNSVRTVPARRTSIPLRFISVAARLPIACRTPCPVHASMTVPDDLHAAWLHPDCVPVCSAPRFRSASSRSRPACL